MDPTNNDQRPQPPSPFGAPATQAQDGEMVGMENIYPAAEKNVNTNPNNYNDGFNQSNQKNRHGFRDNWRSGISTVLLFLLAPVIALSIAAFVLQSYQVDGQSMETTLQDHDRLIVDKMPRTWARITKHTYIPHRGDIIIFNQSGLPDTSLGEQKQLIKRVIGVPGDRIVVKDGAITIYNQSHPQGYNPDKTGAYTITAPTTPGSVDQTLSDGQIFVCGDNRTNSEDSRYFGAVNSDNIVGKLVLRLLPLSRIKSF